MRIYGLPPQPKVNQTQHRSEAGSTRKGGEIRSDSVEISQNTPSVDELSAQAKAASTSDSARISAVRERVQSGFYDSRQVREQIAEGLLESGGLREVVAQVGEKQVLDGELAQVPDTRADRVQEARERADTGFYDAAEVRTATAEGILDELA
jgi:hypothetical protein